MLIVHDIKAVEARGYERGRQAVLKEAIAICRRIEAHWATFHSVAPSAAAQCAGALEDLLEKSQADTPTPKETT